MGVDLKYHIPPLGLVRTTLRAEAFEAYKALDTCGEVDRLKKLDHLGILRRVHEGAHHPRWEYIVLICALADWMKSQVPEAHLGSGPVLRDGAKTSGTELIKLWALLLNTGHLEWTFTAERALLAELRRSDTLSQALLQSLPDDELRRYAKGVLDGERVYQVFHVLAVYRLSTCISDEAVRRLCFEALRCFLIPGAYGEAARRIVEVYRAIRRLAYFVLDTYYTPSVASLDIFELLTDRGRLGVMLAPPESPTGTLLEAIETHLYQTVYLSHAATKRIAAVIPSLQQLIRVTASKKGLGGVVESLARGRLQAKALDRSPQLRHVVHLPFRVSQPFRHLLLPPAKPLTEEADWLKRCPAKVRRRVVISVWPYPDSRQEHVDLFIEDDAKGEALQRGLVQIVRRLRQLYLSDLRSYGKTFGPRLLHDLLYGRLALAIIEAVLREAFENVERWEFRPNPGSRDAEAVLVPSKGDVHPIVAEEISKLHSIRAATTRARRDELRALDAAIRTEPAGCYIVLGSRAQAYKTSGTVLGECDGVWVAVRREQVNLGIVEAKNVARKAESAIRQQVEAMLTRLGIHKRWSLKEITVVKKSKVHPSYGKAVFVLG